MTETTSTTRGPDPDAEAFRVAMAELHGEAQQRVGHVFAWLDRCLETGEKRGEIDVVLALAGLADGNPLSHVLGDLLNSADMRMPCPAGRKPNHDRNHAHRAGRPGSGSNARPPHDAR
jgi:hypothetical protein